MTSTTIIFNFIIIIIIIIFRHFAPDPLGAYSETLKSNKKEDPMDETDGYMEITACDSDNKQSLILSYIIQRDWTLCDQAKAQSPLPELTGRVDG